MIANFLWFIRTHLNCNWYYHYHHWDNQHHQHHHEIFWCVSAKGVLQEEGNKPSSLLNLIIIRLSSLFLILFLSRRLFARCFPLLLSYLFFLSCANSFLRLSSCRGLSVAWPDVWPDARPDRNLEENRGTKTETKILYNIQNNTRYFYNKPHCNSRHPKS